jgi:hypothetical protein
LINADNIIDSISPNDVRDGDVRSRVCGGDVHDDGDGGGDDGGVAQHQSRTEGLHKQKNRSTVALIQLQEEVLQ